jgi:MPBQ/MSBQ methyltransferase
MSHDTILTAHYAHSSLSHDVEASIVALGKNPAQITRDDLELIDEFHMGGRPATRALFQACGFASGARLLDIGAGFGGPARVAAADFGCDVHGIDLTAPYVAIATDLSRRVGLDASTRFSAASALALPFAENAFDGAYMIHVGMNIADKAALMREVHRVVKPGGTFGIYDIMRIGEGALTFPLPWSSEAVTSAIATSSDYRAALEAAGFRVVGEEDRRQTVRQSAQPTPPMLPHRGPGWGAKVVNLATMVQTGLLAPTILIARR